MSLTSLLTTFWPGIGTFAVTTIGRLFFHHMNNIHEERLTMHKYYLSVNKREMEDTQDARHAGNLILSLTQAFVEIITSVGLWSLPTLLMVCYVLGHAIPISMPVTTTEHFLFWSRTSTIILVMKGLPFFPFIPQIVGMMYGFLFGIKVCSK